MSRHKKNNVEAYFYLNLKLNLIWMRCKDFRISRIGYLVHHYLLHFDTEIQIIDAGGELSTPTHSCSPLGNNNHDSSRFSHAYLLTP